MTKNCGGFDNSLPIAKKNAPAIDWARFGIDLQVVLATVFQERGWRPQSLNRLGEKKMPLNLAPVAPPVLPSLGGRSY